MSEINVLDKSIYNRIAAGEVVEKPASIVKELVENSIDAGATTVSIEVRGGGVDFIRVVDNGKGISPVDVPTAFLAHATSKIKEVDDLDSISTLGFRGEALPSIAAVSKVSMQTRRKGAEMGYRYVIDNGVVCDSGEIGCPFGTSVVVENLFGNIPARKKFLAKSTTEESAISSLVSRIILANYNVAISLTINGKSIYRSSGQGVESAIRCIYGEEYFANLQKIDANEYGIRVYGYVGKPYYTKHNKTYQTVIINGRYVVSEDISYWIYGCYYELLMKRQFPTFVLYVQMPYDMVDVNVHPNKLEVKFANSNQIKRIITDTIRNTVINAAKAPKDLNLDKITTQGEEFFLEDDSDFTAPSARAGLPDNPDFVAENDSASLIADPTIEEIQPKIIISRETQFKDAAAKQRESSSFSSMVDRKTYNSIADHSSTYPMGGGGAFNESDDPFARDKGYKIEKTEFFESFTPSTQQDMGLPVHLEYVGKIFNTYLIFTCEDDAYFVDQHAAHERILYDKLEAAFKAKAVTIQKMLLPYEFSVSAEEGNILESKLDQIESVGFLMSRKSKTTFELGGVPVLCGDMNIKSFLDAFISGILTSDSVDNFEIFKSKLMQTACKSAVKGEMDLNKSEISDLIKAMKETNCVIYCPHGRPIIVKISKREVEKWFKRIV